MRSKPKGGTLNKQKDIHKGYDIMLMKWQEHKEEIKQTCKIHANSLH